MKPNELLKNYLENRNTKLRFSNGREQMKQIVVDAMESIAIKDKELLESGMAKTWSI